MTEITIPELRRLCIEALTKVGVSAHDAGITVDHYLENELSGKTSHGMVRVIQAVKTVQARGLPRQAPEIIHDAGNIAVIDAHGALGPVAGHAALALSLERAKKHGMSMIGVRHYIANSGSMAYYLRRLAEAGLIGMMSCNSEAIVSPPEGIDPMVGTNPIGLCVPSADDTPFIADFATSAIAYGKIMVMEEKGQPVPDGLLIDKEGHPSTDPADAFEGSIKPLAGYAGFSLALMVELLAGLLIGTMACKRDAGKDGLFIIAIDPTAFGQNDYAQRVAEILMRLRESRPVLGQDQVPLPGDRSAPILESTLAAGRVDVADKTLQTLRGFV